MMDNVQRDYGGRNVTVNEAAKIMGKTPQFIRIGLQRGLLPIGVAYKTDSENEQYDYYISPKLLYDFTGYPYQERNNQIEKGELIYE